MMKKTNFLKIVLSMALAVFIANGAMAQPYQPWTDMTTPATAETDSLVIGGEVPYYVEPDPVLNNMTEAYDPTLTNDEQGITSNFNWSASSGDVTLTSATGADGDEDPPYVTVTSDAEATYTISVQEESAGECLSDNTTTQDIVFIGEPSYTLNTAEYEVCNGVTAGDAGIELEISGPGLANWSNFYFKMDSEKTWDNDGTSETLYTNNDTIVEVGTRPGAGKSLFNSDKAFYAHDPGDGKRVSTYTFTLKGMNHHISRKGDYLDLPGAVGDPKTQLDLTTYDETDGYNIDETLYTWFSETEQTVTVTVYPTPETGDIYYVPSDYEL